MLAVVDPNDPILVIVEVIGLNSVGHFGDDVLDVVLQAIVEVQLEGLISQREVLSIALESGDVVLSRPSLSQRLDAESHRLLDLSVAEGLDQCLGEGLETLEDRVFWVDELRLEPHESPIPKVGCREQHLVLLREE